MKYSAIVVAALLAAAPGCEGERRSDPYLGNMGDFSYAGRRGKTYGPTASGGSVKLTEHAGRFVWVDYAAPWCGPCTPQARIIKTLERAYGDKVVFLTLLTSDSKPGDSATRATAGRWARQFGLDPDRVAASSEWQRKIPQHVLFSPTGQTLYWQVGLQSEADIRAALGRHMTDWRRWYEENKNSLSVLISEIDG